MAVLKRDLLKLSRSMENGQYHCDVGIISRVLILDSSNDAHRQSPINTTAEEEQIVAFIEFSDSNGAEEALLSLDGALIGGTNIVAYRLKHSHSSADNQFTAVSSTGCISTPMETETTLPLKRTFESTSTRIEYECVYSEEFSTDPQEADAAVANEEVDVSKYVKAKEAPRVGGHVVAKQSIPV